MRSMALTFYSYLVSAKTKYSYFFKALDFQVIREDLAKDVCDMYFIKNEAYSIHVLNVK